MQIALLTHEPFFPPSGGGSAAAVYLVRELTRRGHDVVVFGPDLPDLAGVERRFGIRFHPFRTWQMGRTTRWRTPKYLAYPFALERLVLAATGTDRRPDVLVAQHAISAVAAGRLRRRLGIPIVLNLLDCLTGFLETWPPFLMPRSAARALVRYELTLPRRVDADGVLTVSDALRDRLLATGYPPERVLATYYGYDAALFRPPSGEPSTAAIADPVVVMHGSFDQHHLGRIAHLGITGVVRRRPQVRFRFIGPETPVLRKCLHAIRRETPEARLDVAGFTPYDQVPAALAEASVGITPYEPSTGTHCAFVAKTVEYLALGLPVVSTPLESALRYYRGLEGITFSGPAGEGFAEAILAWLARTPSERRRAVEPARARVAGELDWSVLTRRAAEFIETTVRTRRA